MEKKLTKKRIRYITDKKGVLFSKILKSHRSYLVTINYVDTVSGNAQGYKLPLKNYSEKIPVSRNMISTFNTKMNNR
ncbi:MAG: LytTR family transcriptional regulator DNA-binding domain-containing protein [Polaribacter sp.]|uniref:LytTR family transcriptional regulator DNA-binding domain-containing protein n=1 Tax=Polaribacter sp. TaxID=1920175 RepID=UPI00384B4643